MKENIEVCLYILTDFFQDMIMTSEENYTYHTILERGDDSSYLVHKRMGIMQVSILSKIL